MWPIWSDRIQIQIPDTALAIILSLFYKKRDLAYVSHRKLVAVAHLQCIYVYN